MNGLRVIQKKDEAPGLFAMRAFALAFDVMDQAEARAAAQWMVTVAYEKQTQRDRLANPPGGAA